MADTKTEDVKTEPATTEETPPVTVVVEEEKPKVEEAPPATPEAPVAKDLADELERTRKALKDANAESATRRKKLEKYEADEKAREEAQLSELEKEKKRADEAVARAEAAEKGARESLIRSAFVAEAAKIGAAHPDDVYVLADRAQVEVDDSGRVTGVAEAVKALADAGRIPLTTHKPPAPNLDGGAGGQDRPGQNQVKLTATEIETARRMNLSPEKYAAQKLALQQEATA